MRKSRVIGFAIAAILMVGTVAEGQSTTQPKEQRHAAGRRNGAERGRGGLLRGVTLSDAEKTQVAAIHARYAAEAKPIRESLRPAMQEVRAARQKHDSAAVKATWDRTAGDRQKLQALRQRERTEIRTALTPEHQQAFDANAKAMEQRRAEWRKNGKSERSGRAARRGRRGTSQS